MSMAELIERLERAKPSCNIKNVQWMVGTLSAMENSRIAIYDSLQVIRLQKKDHNEDFDVIIKRDEISQVNTFDNAMEIKLKPRAFNRVNEYLSLFEHQMVITLQHKIEIYLQSIGDRHKSQLYKFLNLKEVVDVERERPQRACRKKPHDDGKDNADPLLIEPEKKKSKLKNEPVETINLTGDESDNITRRSTRTRRGRSKPNSTNLDDPDNVNATEEMQISKAIEMSLKTAGGSGAINLDTPEKKQEFDPYADVDKTIELFRYQFIHGIDAEITVKMEDYLCLGKAEYLSDVIIDFIFSYIFFEKFTDEQREKVYIFPTSFYSMYSTNAGFAGWNMNDNKNKSAIQKRYERVEGMIDMSVNIFEKEFLVFPLFQNAHWFLAIVCFPTLPQNLIYATDEPTDDDVRRNLRNKSPTYNPTPLKTSCILTFDSIKTNPARQATAKKHIYNFLQSHHEQHYKGSFELGKLSGCQVPVPRQTNNFDCGCFIIEFLERFFVTDPIKDFRLPISKKDWFSSQEIRLRKRREIVEIIKDKMKIYAEMKNVEMPELPELLFASEKIINLDAESDKDKKNSDDDNNNGSDNNNDEGFNNNNDFNCVDSNQVAPVAVSSSESVQNGETTADTFDRLKSTSYRNMHTRDQEEDDNDSDGQMTEEEILGAVFGKDQLVASVTAKILNGESSLKDEKSTESPIKSEVPTETVKDENPPEISSKDEEKVIVDVSDDVEMKEIKPENVKCDEKIDNEPQLNDKTVAEVKESENVAIRTKVDEKMECDDNDSKKVDEPQEMDTDQDIEIPPTPPTISQVTQPAESESSQEIGETPPSSPKVENRSKIVDESVGVEIPSTEEESCDSRSLATAD